MSADSLDRTLWLWTGAELAALAVLAVVLGASVVGATALLSSVSVRLRTAAFLFLLVELLIPVWVSVDQRRRPGPSDAIWVHATAMPLVNVFGLAGYLAHRRQRDRT